MYTGTHEIPHFAASLVRLSGKHLRLTVDHPKRVDSFFSAANAPATYILSTSSENTRPLIRPTRVLPLHSGHAESKLSAIMITLPNERTTKQACGSFFTASLSLGARSRNRLHDNGGVEALCRLVRATSTKEPLKVRSLHALLNLSTETG